MSKPNVCWPAGWLYHCVFVQTRFVFAETHWVCVVLTTQARWRPPFRQASCRTARPTRAALVRKRNMAGCLGMGGGCGRIEYRIAG